MKSTGRVNTKKATQTLSTSQDWMLSLSEYQNSDGIPIKDQLILLRNPEMFREFYPVIFPHWGNNRFSRKALSIVKWLWSLTSNGGIRVPSKSDKLFLGYYDKSFDNPFDVLNTLFDVITSSPHREFCLVLGKGDYCIRDELVGIIPDNLQVIFANNVDSDNPKLQFLPMGRDFRNLHLLRDALPTSDKEILVYCNFSTNTHPVRQRIYESIRLKPFVEFDHMGDFLAYSISRQKFLEKLAKSKFCICPRGNAIDTFRLWDCLYLGTVPIVVREAAFHDQLKDLPILFLDDPAEFAELNEVFLEDIYLDFIETKFNYSKLRSNYWFKKSR